jgi:hypothetical protein
MALRLKSKQIKVKQEFQMMEATGRTACASKLISEIGVCPPAAGSAKRRRGIQPCAISMPFAAICPDRAGRRSSICPGCRFIWRSASRSMSGVTVLAHAVVLVILTLVAEVIGAIKSDSNLLGVALSLLLPH